MKLPEPYREIITCPECGQDLVITVTVKAIHRSDVTVITDFSDIRSHTREAHGVELLPDD